MATLGELLKQVRSSIGSKANRVKIKFAIDLTKSMRSKNLKSKDLAKLLDAKPSLVSKVLGGESNLTIKTMVKFADALGQEVKIHLEEVAQKIESSESWESTDSHDNTLFTLTKSANSMKIDKFKPMNEDDWEDVTTEPVEAAA